MERKDRLISVKELADYLDVPVTTLYQGRYRTEGPPGFRMGRHVRFRWSDVEEWTNISSKMSPGDPETESSRPRTQPSSHRRRATTFVVRNGMDP